MSQIEELKDEITKMKKHYNRVKYLCLGGACFSAAFCVVYIIREDWFWAILHGFFVGVHTTMYIINVKRHYHTIKIGQKLYDHLKELENE